MSNFFKTNQNTILKLLPPVIAMSWFFYIAYHKTYVDITSTILLVFSFLWLLFWAAKHLGKENN